MLSTLIIVALQDSRKVFSFLLTNWLRIPWFFSRGRTRLAFSFFLTYNFLFFPRAVIRDTFISTWRFFFVFFLVPWMLVDIRLVIYISIYIVIHRQTCFVLSELISVARQTRFPELGSKPGWFKRQSKILPLSHDVWIVSTRPPTSKSSRPFNNPLVIVPNAPITIDTIITYMFHSFFNSLARSRYLSFFSLSFRFILWSAETAKSTILQILFFFFFVDYYEIWSSGRV